METIQQRIDAARGRLILRQWAGRLAWCLLIGFTLAAVAVLAPKILVLPTLPPWWTAAWLAGAGVVGLLAATVWTYLAPKSRLDAAVEIDQRYELRERIASAMQLQEEDLLTEAGSALARDAERAIGRVEVSERFTFGLDRKAWWPVVPIAIAVLAGTLLTNRTAEATAEKADTQQVTAKKTQEAAEKARKELKKKREQAEKEGLKDASALLKKVEEGTAELAKKEPKDTTKAAVKLNDLTKQLEERKRKLGGGAELRNQLNRMKDLGRGPAEKAADAMKQGDWKKAMKEVEQLRQKIASGKLSKEQQEQLAKQLGKMQKKLGEAAAKQAAQKKELERQLAEAQRKGDLKQAGKLQQKMDQLAQKAPQMQKMQQMAQQMKQAQQAMQQGDAKQAADAMDKLAQQMEQMDKAAGEMKMLDAAMTDIQDAKQAMGMQGGKPMAQGGGKGKNEDGPPGPGMGEGRGKGDRPDEKNPVAFRDSKVKQNVGRGASTFGGLVKGPSIKGEVVESIKTQMTAETAKPADPLTSERLPRSRREHAEEYFKSLREKL